MKKCPQCGRDYNDDTLSFCLDDGSELLFGPSSGESPTVILPDPSSGDAPTRHQFFRADPRTLWQTRRGVRLPVMFGAPAIRREPGRFLFEPVRERRNLPEDIKRRRERRTAGVW
jgi:hypothetical protein